jgi:hypothetical protein
MPPFFEPAGSSAIGVARGRLFGLSEERMNTLSKVLIFFCVILSTVAFASWSPATSRNVSGVLGTTSAGVALATSADGRTVYYAHTRDLFKSTDGGETWVMLK